MCAGVCVCAHLPRRRTVQECICLCLTVCTEKRGWEEQRGGEEDSERMREGS